MADNTDGCFGEHESAVLISVSSTPARWAFYSESCAESQARILPDDAAGSAGQADALLAAIGTLQAEG